MLNVQMVNPGERKKRIDRRPRFPIAGGMRAMGLYPLCMTPVLPGETLKGARSKFTVVSAPVLSPLAGAWLETFGFYVPLTSINEELGDMIIGETVSPTPYVAAADRLRYFTKAGQIDWCYLATEKVFEEFFLDNDEAARFTVPVADTIFETKLVRTDFSESMIENPTEPATPTDVQELSEVQRAFLLMRQRGMENMSYEDYLRKFGVRTVAETKATPEIVHYRRYFSTPKNVIDPTTGAPTGAFYWNVDEKDEKPKYFKEPGFVIFYAVWRPKVYDSTQVSSVAASMWGMEDFFPLYTLDDVTASLQVMDLDNMPFLSATGTTEYVLDRNDLLVYGEQFLNGYERLSLPLNPLRAFGATPQDGRGMYLSNDALIFPPATVAEDRVCDYEGLITLEIKGHIQDNT